MSSVNAIRSLNNRPKAVIAILLGVFGSVVLSALTIVNPNFTLLGLAVLCFILVGFMRIEWLAYSLPIVLPLDVYITLPDYRNFFLSQVVIAAAFLLSLPRVMVRKQNAIPNPVLLLWLLVMAALMSLVLAESAWSPEDWKSLSKLAVFPMGAFVIAASCKSPKFIQRFFICIVATNIIVVANGFYLYLTGYSSDPLGSLLNIQRTVSTLIGQVERLTSTFRYSNEFAAYLLIITLLYVGILISIERQDRFGPKYLCLAALLIANLGLMVLTYTRGVWFACSAVILVLFLVNTRARRKRIGSLFLLLLSVSVGVYTLYLTVPSFRSRLLESFDFGEVWGFEGRRLIWLGAWQAFLRNIWTGVGIGRFDQVNLKSFAVASNIANAENIYLTYLVEMGLLGLTALLLPLILIAKDVYRRLKLSVGEGTFETAFLRGASCALIGVFLYALVDPVLTSAQNGVMFWALFALLATKAGRSEDKVSTPIYSSDRNSFRVTGQPGGVVSLGSLGEAGASESQQS